MKRYIVLYKAPLSVAMRFAQATPEEAQQGLQQWERWAQKLGPALLDPGKPLGNAMAVTRTKVTKTDSRIIGMSIVQAVSMENALDFVRDHHHLSWTDDCEIEVLEEMPIPELAQPSA